MTARKAQARWQDPIAALPGFVMLAIFAVLGGLAALGQPPQGLWYVTVLALAVCFALFPYARTPMQAAWRMWAFGVVYFAVALRWLVEPFQVEADLYGWMAPLALTLMAAGLALFWGLAAGVAARLTRPRLALVVAWSLMELARAYALTGFAWGGFAQIWVDTDVAQSLAKIGPQGLSVATLLLAAMPFLGNRGWMVRAGQIGAVALVLFVLLPHRMTGPPDTASDAPTIRIVQPNAPQHQKWDRAYAPTFFARQIEATRADPPPDLIVWPETAIPQLFNSAGETLAVVADAAAGTPVVLGMQRAEGFDAYYNSLLLMDARGAVTQTYDKHHLVPFGEYLPFGWLFRRLGVQALADRVDGGYTPGPGPQLIDLGPLGMALPLICYEAVFPQHASYPGARPAFLLQITNDAWFGAYAGPQQHLAQARMRAIEQGLPMVRSANTGISAMIDAKGRITASLPLGVHGFVDAALPMVAPATLYSQTGDTPVAVLLLVALGGLIIWPLTFKEH